MWEENGITGYEIKGSVDNLQEFMKIEKVFLLDLVILNWFPNISFIFKNHLTHICFLYIQHSLILQKVLWYLK